MLISSKPVSKEGLEKSNLLKNNIFCLAIYPLVCIIPLTLLKNQRNENDSVVNLY